MGARRRTGRASPPAGEHDPLQEARDALLREVNAARARGGLPPTTFEAATAADWALGGLQQEERQVRQDFRVARWRLRELARRRAALLGELQEMRGAPEPPHDT